MEITYYALDIYATFDWGRLDGIGDIGKWLTTQPPATFLYMQPTRQFHYHFSGQPLPSRFNERWSGDWRAPDCSRTQIHKGFLLG